MDSILLKFSVIQSNYLNRKYVWGYEQKGTLEDIEQADIYFLGSIIFWSFPELDSALTLY